MDGLNAYRRAAARAIAERFGMDPNQPRDTVGQMQAAGLEHDLRVLPVAADEFEFVQDSSGTLYFMAGIDGADSTNPV